MRLFRRPEPRKALVSSARRLSLPKGSRRLKPLEWQRRAFGYNDTVGEISNASGFFGSAFSRLHLFPGELDDEGKVVPTENPQVVEAVGDLGAQMGGQAALMERSGINLFLAGELYLVGVSESSDEIEEGWHILSVDELRSKDKAFVWVSAEGTTQLTLNPDEDPVIRIWRPHARFASLATSRMRGVLDRAEELEALGDQVMARTLSRLADVGVLLIDDDLTVQSRVPAEDDDEMPPFTRELFEVAKMAIENKRSPAAMIPVVLEGKNISSEEKVRFVNWAREMDEHDMERRREIIERVAAGLELPKDLLLGVGDINHWGAWAISDETYQAYVRPAAELFASGLNRGYLWPLLEGIEGRERFRVGVDASGLIESPDRTNDAREAHSSHIISDEAYRRESGWAEDDAPDEEELRRRVILPNLSALVQIGVVRVTEAREMIGLEPGEERDPLPTTRLPAPVEAPSPNGDERRPEPEKGPPTRVASAAPSALTDVDRALLERLVSLTDAAFQRALEKAGNRIRTKAQGSGLLSVIDGVRAEDVSLTLGKQRVASLGLEEEALLRGALDSLEPKVERELSAALEQAVMGAGDLGETDIDLILERTLPERSRLLEVAVAFLLAGLLGDLEAKLFVREVPTRGEVADTHAPIGIIREAIDRLGGGEQGKGLARGTLVADVLKESGLRLGRLRWNYGLAARRTFPPHLALDGEEFEDEDDEKLIPPPSAYWLGVDKMYPGDHAGCLCGLSPIEVTGIELAASGKSRTTQE